MSRVVIIGNGPGGVSAALYTARAGIETIIIGKDGGALGKAERVENYYGVSSPLSGQDIVDAGIAQAKAVGAKVLEEEVVSIGYGEKFVVKTNKSEYEADAVIIATGSPRTTPKLPGIAEFAGRGVSYCAICDGFFFRGLDVAVLGCCEYAENEAKELLPIAKSVTLVTNGVEPIEGLPAELSVIRTPIAELVGQDRLSGVRFEDGSILKAQGVFVAYGTAGSVDLARKLGIYTEGNKILVDKDMATNVPGIFAAGDCTGGMLQIAKAVYEGAAAGFSVIGYLRKKKERAFEE